jgi:hypothetical protein
MVRKDPIFEARTNVKVSRTRFIFDRHHLSNRPSPVVYTNSNSSSIQ